MAKRTAFAFAALLLAAAPATAQFQSASYKFLQAVKDSKNQDVEDALNKPGSSIINTRDPSSGEGALHIVVKRGDATYLRFLLAKGADPNLRDGRGNTPLILAVIGGYADLVPILTQRGANLNQGNSSGETPLIMAVHRRDTSMVHDLLAAGADPDQRDIVAGQSARDYAKTDTRSPVIAKMLADAPVVKKKVVSGPKL
jgi:uncharacterized protein